MYIHKMQIGNIRINIYTNRKNLKLPYFPPTQKTIEKDIIIYLEENTKEKEKILKNCQNTWKFYYPKEIVNFYEVLNKKLVLKINLDNHVNCYYKKENEIIAYFPYSTDNFLLKYSYDNNIIKLFGKPINLYRILTDFINVENEYFPLHASCVQKEGNVIGIMSASGGGKTSLVLKLIQKGYEFVSDDSLYMSKNKIIPVSDIIAVSKTFPNHPLIEEETKKHKEEKILIHLEEIIQNISLRKIKDYKTIRFFSIEKVKTNWNGLEDIKEPFPCISHHSFWCLHYFETKNQKSFIETKMNKSFIFWQKQIQKIKPIYLDFNNFENSIEKILKEIS